MPFRPPRRAPNRTTPAFDHPRPQPRDILFAPRPSTEPLSAREWEILQLLVDGLSNREIAERLYLSPETVRWYNKQLYGKLGVSSRAQATARALRDGLLSDQPPPAALRDGLLLDQPTSAAPRTLPAQVTSFVGRDRELDQIRRLLLDPGVRLVTLSGPPGTGKTRLGLRAGEQLAGSFRDGVRFVDLTPIRQPQLLDEAIAAALNLTPGESGSLAGALERYLAGRELLLILDNFEHLIQAAPAVHRHLTLAAGLKVLVTSREVLRVYGEHEFPVSPLELPDLGPPNSLPELLNVPSVELFVWRARAVQSDFQLTEANAGAVAAICVRVDGLPLAIELAAARIKLLPVHQLAVQLDHPLAVLERGPRHAAAHHQTLRRTLAWSYDLLPHGEARLLARASTFRGGASLEAMERVCSSGLGLSVVAGIESLMDKSLVRRDIDFDGNPRFGMLETIREYAGERLEESGEQAAIQRRHAVFFAGLAEQAEPHTRGGSGMIPWLRRLEIELDNLRLALEWCFAGGEAKLGLRLVAALGHFWWRQCHAREGMYWAELGRERSAQAAPQVQAGVLYASARVAFGAGEFALAYQYDCEAAVRYRRLGDSRSAGWSLILQAIDLPLQGDEHFARAYRTAEEGLELLQRAGDGPGVIQAMISLGELLRLRGDLGGAAERFGAALQLARKCGDTFRENVLSFNLGFIHQSLGECDAAASLFLQGMRSQGWHKPYIAELCAAMAGLAAARGDGRRAAVLLGAGRSLAESIGLQYEQGERRQYARNEMAARQLLDPACFEAAYAEGRRLRFEQAVELLRGGKSPLPGG